MKQMVRSTKRRMTKTGFRTWPRARQTASLLVHNCKFFGIDADAVLVGRVLQQVAEVQDCIFPKQDLLVPVVIDGLVAKAGLPAEVAALVGPMNGPEVDASGDRPFSCDVIAKRLRSNEVDANDAARCADGVITDTAFVDKDGRRRSSRYGFWCWLHPATKRHPATNFKADLGGGRMASLSQVTPEAAADVTAPVSASPLLVAETYEQAFSRLVRAGWPPDLAAYALDDVDPWAARHNADTWHWRSDSTGTY